MQPVGALHRAAVAERLRVKQDVLRLPAAGVGHRPGGNGQRALSEKPAACTVNQRLLRRGHRHARHQPLLPLNGQALQAGQGALVVNAVLAQREGVPLHGAAVFKDAAAERHVPFAEELPAVIQRLRGDIRPPLAHQRAGRGQRAAGCGRQRPLAEQGPAVRPVAGGADVRAAPLQRALRNQLACVQRQHAAGEGARGRARGQRGAGECQAVRSLHQPVVVHLAGGQGERAAGDAPRVHQGVRGEGGCAAALQQPGIG